MSISNVAWCRRTRWPYRRQWKLHWDKKPLTSTLSWCGMGAIVLPGEVHHLTLPKSRAHKHSVPTPGICFCWGKSNHPPAPCHFKDAKCHHCERVGHIKSIHHAQKKQLTKVPKAHRETLGLYVVKCLMSIPKSTPSSTCIQQISQNSIQWL